MEEDPVVNQVMKLAEAIQQLQQRVAELELQIVPSTLQEVRDQREATAWSAVERIKALAMECKQLSSHSAQTYERLTEDPELKDTGVTAPGRKAASNNSTSIVETPVSS
jgi:uncharacterized membrane-anchored protein YhcB (DUF1043 family)